MTYEGSENYETATIALEIDNDEPKQNYWLEAAKNAQSKTDLADMMKDSYEENAPELSGIYETLLNSAMKEIDWYELAEDKIREFGERIKEGETSQGSCKLMDIVDGIRDLIPDELIDDFDLYDEDEPDDCNEMAEIFGDICDRMNEIAPDGLIFGTSEGDGASYGFWKIEADTIDDVQDREAYLDDIDGHIEQLETEADTIDDCEKRDALRDRIEYLKERREAGDRWVDNDITASPTAWKTLKTYNDIDALEAYKRWTAEA